MSVPPFIRILNDHVRSESLLQPDDRVVVGVSGGPDSMALLHGLVGLNQHADFRLHLHIAHLNHQLRGEAAEQDAAFVQAAADHLDLPCTIEQRDVQAIAAGHSVSAGEHLPAEEATWLGYGPTVGAVEETARNERYALFERVALSIGAGVVCVGHQADDNAETILHRIVRGTGLRGIAGIPARRALRPGSDVRVVRPLLKFPRRKLLEFLDESGIPHREDQTNAYPSPDDVFAGDGTPSGAMPTRNLIRNVVLPLLESRMNPNVREALVRLSEQARWTEDYLREVAQRTFETLVVSRSQDELVLSARGLARRHRIVQAELIRLAIATFQVGEQDLSFAHLAAVCGLLGGRTSGKRVQLPGGLTVTKRYDRLIFSLPDARPQQLPPSEIGVHVPGRTVLPVRRLAVVCEVIEGGDTVRGADATREPRNRFEETIDFDTLQLPLVVRRRRGERFWPLGAPGSKKLSEFLADAKIDPLERDRIAILCDQRGPIWVIGQRIAERVKLTPQTRRVLHIRVDPL